MCSDSGSFAQVHTPSIDGEWEDNEGAVACSLATELQIAGNQKSLLPQVIIKNQRMRGPDGVEVEAAFMTSLLNYFDIWRFPKIGVPSLGFL